VLFAIRSIPDDRLVGTCQLHSLHTIYRSAELQIRIGERDNQGKGYGSEAVYLLLRHGFEDRNLHRIGLHVFDDNLAAIRIYTKAGFKEEGRLREAAFINGRLKDILLFGLLRSEFRRT
jgi:RimJ/RimL family protein N-acetyltransferase